MMKINFIIALTILFTLLYSCKNDDNNSPVGVGEGQISFTENDTTINFTIIDISTEIFEDTTSILVESVNKDSTMYFYLQFEKISHFGEKDYLLSAVNENPLSFIQAYMRKSSGSNLDLKYYTVGRVSVLKYSEMILLQGKFEFIIPNLNPDSTKVETMKGEFNASYLLLDPNRVPNLPILPNTMEVSVNDSKKILNVHGAAINTEQEKKYIINGYIGNETAIAISFIGIEPELNKNYKPGEKIVIENNPTVIWDNDTGYVEASYFNKGAIYSVNENFGSGNFKVTKLSTTTMQGTFDFTAEQKNDPTKKVICSQGMYYAKFK